MSKTFLRFGVGFTVNSPENLPPTASGEQMDAVDVADELCSVIQSAVAGWYQQRGHQLLAHEPVVG